MPLESGDVAIIRRPAALVVLAVLAVLAVHVIASWGYIGVYWGDSGRWLYEVDQYANGARLYRDVYWAFPPLGMWIVGGTGRLIGSDLVQVWSITATIATLVAVAYAIVVAQLLPLRLALLAGMTGMALGAVYASDSSAPLVSGMYSPAVPVAIMFAFAQLALFLREWGRPSLPGAVLVGALGGAGVLTKHDVWFVCVLLTAAAAVVTPTGARSRAARAVAALTGFAAVAGTGLAVLVAQHGAAALGPIFSGHGRLQEVAGLNYPNLAQAVVELAALGLATAVVGIIAWATGAWRSRGAVILIVAGAAITCIALGVWLLNAELLARHVLAAGKSEFAPPFERMLSPFSTDVGARLRRAVAAFRLELIRHVIPLSVPLVALAIAFARRKHASDPLRWRLLVVLLLLALSLRARRMISFVEWSSLMLEVPVYVFALVTLWRLPSRVLTRAVMLGCAALLVGAMFAQRRFGWGIATRRGAFPQVQTSRGLVRLRPGLAEDLRYVRDLADIADPSGSRPLLSFGYSAGHNYLTGRPGVGSLSDGFLMSLYPTPDSAYRVARAQRHRLILIDNPSFVDAVQAPAFAPWRWQPRMRQNHYLRVDRPLFEMLLDGCRKVTAPGRRSMFTVYDCATPHARDVPP